MWASQEFSFGRGECEMALGTRGELLTELLDFQSLMLWSEFWVGDTKAGVASNKRVTIFERKAKRVFVNEKRLSP